MWGFTNDMTSPMVNAFSKIFLLDVTEAGLVTVANFLSYLLMAIPAALFVKRYGYKWGVLLALGIYAAGALCFYPAEAIGTYGVFLGSFFFMACGLAILETACHPFVYTMGDEDNGIIRLNMAQAFNALGAVIGMFVAHDYVQAGMSPLSMADRQALPQAQMVIIRNHDLEVLCQPYVFIVAFIILLMVVIWFTKFDNTTEHTKEETTEKEGVISELRTIFKVKNYREGVLAQFCYCGAQVACWTYIIQYGTRIFQAEGMTETEAEMMAQNFNIAAIVLFAIGRFVSTWLLRFVSAGRLLAVAAIVAATAVGGVILFTDRSGLYCLVIISGCMSLMFATIFGIALRGLGQHVKLASAGIAMSVFGGAFFPGLQALVISTGITLFGLSSLNISFIIPLLCFVVVALYGHHAYVRHYIFEGHHSN